LKLMLLLQREAETAWIRSKNEEAAQREAGKKSSRARTKTLR
jgi:hypothetical protein